jgi:hypothetical protein
MSSHACCEVRSISAKSLPSCGNLRYINLEGRSLSPTDHPIRPITLLTQYPPTSTSFTLENRGTYIPKLTFRMRYTNSAAHSYAPQPSSDPYRYAYPSSGGSGQVYTPVQRGASKRDAPLFSVKQDLAYNRYHTHHFTPKDAYPPHSRTFAEYNARYNEREREQKGRRKSSRKRKSMPVPPPPPPPVQIYCDKPRHSSRRRSASPQVESMFYMGTENHPPMFRSKRSRNPYSPSPSPPPAWLGGDGSRRDRMARSPSHYGGGGSGHGESRLRRVARFLFGSW